MLIILKRGENSKNENTYSAIIKIWKPMHLTHRNFPKPFNWYPWNFALRFIIRHRRIFLKLWMREYKIPEMNLKSIVLRVYEHIGDSSDVLQDGNSIILQVTVKLIILEFASYVISTQYITRVLVILDL